jgi:DNA-binding beta-propeller fold protein YncE
LTIYKVPENADFVPVGSGSVTGVPQVSGVSVFEGGKGKENGQLNFPRGLAVDNAGNIFVADTNNDRLQKFSPTGMFVSVIGKGGAGPGEFREPGGTAVDSAGNIYVADVSNHRVQKLKPDGTFLAQWKGPEPGFQNPRDIAIGKDNSIYVVDQGRARIVKSDANGKVQMVWGTHGSDDGQMAGPTSVAVDVKTDRVYVADPSNKRIQVFDPNGKFLAKWPVPEWGTPTGWYFQDLIIDSQVGRIYASSIATDEVLVLDLTGKKIAALKPNPPDRLEGASGVALVRGKLYVLNTYANRLSQIVLEIK